MGDCSLRVAGEGLIGLLVLFPEGGANRLISGGRRKPYRCFKAAVSSVKDPVRGSPSKEARADKGVKQPI